MHPCSCSNGGTTNFILTLTYWHRLKISWTLVQKRLKIGPKFSTTLRKCCGSSKYINLSIVLLLSASESDQTLLRVVFDICNPLCYFPALCIQIHDVVSDKLTVVRYTAALGLWVFAACDLSTTVSLCICENCGAYWNGLKVCGNGFLILMLLSSLLLLLRCFVTDLSCCIYSCRCLQTSCVRYGYSRQRHTHLRQRNRATLR